MTSTVAADRSPRCHALWFATAAIGACWLLPVSVSWRLAPDLGHSWVVPLLMAYLWWERWAARPPLVKRGAISKPIVVAAVAAAAAELAVRLFLTPFPLWPAALALYTLIFAAIVLAGAYLLAGREGMRWAGGPLVLLVSTLPIPSSVESAVIIPLRETWASLAAEISNAVGVPAIAFGTSIQIGGGWVGIDEACGGIRSLQACLMIALFFGEWFRFGVARRFALVIAGFAAALVGNFGRVLFLALRASAGVHAVESVHDLAGGLAMAASLAMTGWLAIHWAKYRFPQANPSPARAGSKPLPLAPRHTAIPLIAAVAALLAANELGTRLWFFFGQPARAHVPQWTAVFPEKHWSFRAAPLPETSRSMLGPDRYRAGTWRDESAGRIAAYYIEWTRGQIARSVPFLHNPTVCLPYAGCELINTLAPITVPWSGGKVTFHTCIFRRSGEEMLVAFTIWDPLRNAPLTPPTQSSWSQWFASQWSDVRNAREDQPAQLLTIMLPWRETAQQNAAGILSALITQTTEN